MNVMDYANWYVENGISVIPVKADGSKSPAYSGWRKYSNEIADSKTIESWFSGSSIIGIGAVPGPASGDMLVLDFEYSDNQSAYIEWFQRLTSEQQKFVSQLPTVVTPSGGRHIWIRLNESHPGGKLARYASGKTKIEIRGEGHQVLAPGCPAECHRTGKLYEWAIPPNENEAFPVLDDEIYAELVAVCCQCNEYTPQEQGRDYDSKQPGIPAGMDSPGNDFNLRGTWAETGLFDAGWTWAKQTGPDKGFLTRPGKESGISASVGTVTSKQQGFPYFWVWSTSTDFTAEVPYSRFAVYAHLKHKGNYSEAAKELYRNGYGARPGMENGVDLSGILGTAPPKAEPKEDKESRPFLWMSELSAQAEDEKWVWEGYLARGGITLFSALWKSGKSTLLSHLLKAFEGNVTEFLGQKVNAARVLYVTEEHQSLWADRRDALMIGDHVGLWSQPFRTNKPTMAEWRSHIASVVEQVAKYRFDCVIYDTLSKMWPVREENDAGQVEEALMPFWALANEGVAIMLVHHSRKSGGDQFVGARGSGGLSAFCDLLMEFSCYSNRSKDCKRVIKAKGRYVATPDKLLIELSQGKYVALGDPDDLEEQAGIAPPAQGESWEQDLQEVLDESGETWMDFNTIDERVTEIRSGVAVRRENLLDRLKKMFEGGEIERKGMGRKGSPYEYRAVCFDSVQDSPPKESGGTETETE